MFNSPLVTTEWLAQHLDDLDLRIVDVRWYLFDKTRTGQSEYLRGHIPGAVWMDLDRDLASPRGQGPGRHPLPTPERFAQAASRAGIGESTFVVAYDDLGAASAARLWWLLRYFGHDQVSLLDGGITRWNAEGRPLQTEIPSVPVASFVPHPHPEMVVNADSVDALRRDPSALVLDVRAAERYEGKIEPIDPRAGHVPGAVSAPYTGNVNEDKRFNSPEKLRARFAQLGAENKQHIVSYCGSGVNACQNIFALELAGFDDTLLYEGSWSDWSGDPNRPMATGPKP